ncbi:MAG: MFS transporter [Phycisphaerae bacterium]
MNSPNTQAAATHTFGYRRRRGLNWVFLGLLYAGYYLCRYNLSVVSPEFTKEFGFNKQEYGAINSGREIGYAIGNFFNGLFTDGLGGKQAMAIGAIGTILLNLVFAGVSLMKWSAVNAFTLSGGAVSLLLVAFVVTRTVDGYLQSFGAPGMVKINTSWFQRRERGKFAGIFGGMIQLGQVGVNRLGGALITGIAIGGVMLVPPQNWRSIFVVMPALLAVILALAWIVVRNHPEQAGYSIAHDDDAHAANPEQKLPLGQVFSTIASNPLSWLNAGAYMCTGFVRKAMDNFWVLYLFEVWHIGKESVAYDRMATWLPIVAVIGSFTTGLISDTIARGRRSPVAAGLYTVETLVLLITLLVLKQAHLANALTACGLLLAISLTVNSSHSIVGTAVTMDIGGRKMAGFALGLVNSFQYLGGFLAGFGLGGLIDAYGWDALFWAMIPFSALGSLLMTGVWLTTRGRDVKGA